MFKSNHANETSQATTPAEGPLVVGDMLGTSRDRAPGAGTRIEPLERPADGAVPPPPPPAPASPAPPGPAAETPARREVAETAPGPAPASAPVEPKRRLVGVLVIAAVVVAGTFVGIRSSSVGDALRTVSVVLVAAAVLIYIAAFVLWLRNRSRRAAPAPSVGAGTASAEAVAAPAPAANPQPLAPAAPVPAAVVSTPVPPAPPSSAVDVEPRVPTLAEVAAELDAAAGRAPSTPAPMIAAVPTPAPPAAAVPAVAAVPPPPPPPPVVQPEAVSIDDPSLDERGHDGSVMDAIAPYTQVVGTPVIRFDADAVAPPAPNGDVPAAATVVPPPPVATVVPPPPPPPAPRAATPPPPPPPAPSSPPPARTAAEVFAAMAATRETDDAGTPGDPTGPLPIEAMAHAHPGAVTRPDPDESVVDLFADGETPGSSAPAAPLVPSEEVRGGWTPPLPAVVEGQALANLPGAEAARSAVGSVAPVVVYRYRKWVLGQMTPGSAFGPVDVDRSPDEWLLLATCGVATLLAWTHEDHHFTYPMDAWVDEILPAHGVRIRDRDLAHDLIMAAALHAGGVDSVPTERLRAYAPGDLVTAMASIHVGLLRLYCGLGRIEPERVLADQYGIGPGDIPLH